MCVERDHRCVTVWQVAAEVFNLVGVDIGSGRFDRRRQIEDDRAFRRGREHFHHRCANFDTEIYLCGRKRLWRILEMPICAGAFGRFVTHHPGSGNGNFADLVLRHPEHNIPPCG